MNSKEMIELFESAQKIYKSVDISIDEKYQILFSGRFYKKLNFKYVIYDGEFWEYTAFCMANYGNENAIKENSMKMMMREFENLVQFEYKIENILNSK